VYDLLQAVLEEVFAGSAATAAADDSAELDTSEVEVARNVHNATPIRSQYIILCMHVNKITIVFIPAGDAL